MPKDLWKPPQKGGNNRLSWRITLTEKKIDVFEVENRPDYVKKRQKISFDAINLAELVTLLM